MERLIGKRVKVYYVTEKNRLVDFKGTIHRVRNNLVFLINVNAYRSTLLEISDQVVNTASSAFVRFDILG